MGYFAYAQYDVIFLVVIAREHSDRGKPWSKVWRVYVAYFFKGIATLALAMTYFFYCLCERSEAISRGEFSQSIYFLLWSWDISLALNMTFIPYRRLRRHFPRRRKRVLSLRGSKKRRAHRNSVRPPY